MAAEEEIVCVIRADGKQLLTTVKGSQKAMEAFAKSGGDALGRLTDQFKNSTDKINSSLSRIDFRGQANELAELGRQFLDISKFIVGAGVKQTQYGKSFEQITGDVAKAKTELALLQKEASKSSFSIDEVTEAGLRYRQAGQSIQDVIKNLEQARDVAAATGQPLADIANFLGRARRGDQDSLTVLQERGIVSKEQLRKLGASFDKGTGAIRGQLQTDRDKLGKALDLGLARFGGADATMVNELSGMLSNLQDETRLAAAELGQAMAPALKEVVSGLRDGVAAFQEFTPETKELIAKAILVGGALSAAAVAAVTLAGPIGTLVAAGASLISTFFLPASVALLPLGLAIEKAGLALYGMATAAAAAGPALLAAKASVLAFGAAVVYMAFESQKAVNALEDFDKQLQSRDDGLAKVSKALGEGGLNNLAKTTAADLKRLGVTAKDLEKALGGVQDAGGGEKATDRQKAFIAERRKQIKALIVDMKELDKAEKDAKSVDKINAQTDPYAEQKLAKEALTLALQKIDTEKLSDTQKIARLKELIANNKLLQTDELERLKVQEKIATLVERQAKAAEIASNKALNNKIKEAKASGNSLDQSAKNASVQAAREPNGSAQRQKLEYDAFIFQRRANQERIAALQKLLDKEKLSAAQKVNLEQRIHALVQKNEADRVTFIENRTKAEEIAAKKKEELRKKEANDLRDAEKANLEAQSALAEREIEQAKKRVSEGTGSQAEVEAAINNRQALSEQLYKLNQEDEDADAKSEEVRALNAKTADLEIYKSRLDAKDAIREYDDSLKESVNVQKEASRESVAAVEQQVADTKAAFQSLEDVQKQLSDIFSPDAGRAAADAVNKRNAEREAARKEAFKRANPDATRVLSEVDRARAEELRRKQFEDSGGQARIDANEARLQKIIASQAKKSPALNMPNDFLNGIAGGKIAPTFTPKEAVVANRMASSAPETRVHVNVNVTVKDTKGRVLPQEGPAEVTVGGRGSRYESTASGMPYSGPGGLSSGVGMG